MKSRRSQSGFSYIEVLIAGVLISVMLLPAMDSLNLSSSYDDFAVQRTSRQYSMVAKMEDTLADSFMTLEAEALATGSPDVASTVYSDTAGSPSRRLVYLSRYDGDNSDSDGDAFTGVDQGLLWIRVEVEDSGQALYSLISETGVD